MIKVFISSLIKINYRLYFTLLLLGLLPLIYSTMRIFFLGDLPVEWGVNIASQLSWVGLFYEIIQEAIILPLFYFIGTVINDKKELSNRIKTGLLVTFLIYSLASLVIIIYAKPLVNFMAQSKELIDATVTYIRLETIGYIFITLVKFSIITFITLEKEKFMFIILFFQMILSIVLDIFFISKLPISLNLWVNGIAYSNIIGNMILLIIIFLIFIKENILIKNERLSFFWLKDFIKIGGISGLESFIRNIIFMLVIIKMVNQVGEQGTFWLANSFIWGWLLLPILQLGELIKKDCGVEGNKAIEGKTFSYFSLTTVIILLWLVTIPLWKPFIQIIFNSSEYEKIYHICIISIVFYILFSYNTIFDSIFYGIGKTNYMLIQSLVINIFYYGSCYYFYKQNIFIPTLDGIAIMFGMSMLFDSVLTFVMFLYLIRKRKLRINFN